jgi:hypothetical protein
MIRYKVRTFLFAAFVLLGSIKSPAQSDTKLAAFVSMLQKKISESGRELKDTDVRLSLVSEKDAETYGLNGKPADAFFINVSNKIVAIHSLSSAGIRNGIYWYLDHLGYRFYFQGTEWHYVPQLQTAFKPVTKTVSPSFTHRRIWYAYGTGSKVADQDYKHWAEANLLGGEEVNAGHSYDAIVNRNKPVFLQHPEYFAQKVEKGKTPPNPKFDVTNEDLVKLVIGDALAQVASKVKTNTRATAMISMDPSDGGGFSTTAAALKIGGPSEQTFYLANKVAKAVREKYPNVKVGLYAYNLHAAPPKFELEPNIVVLVATAMNQSAYRTDELINLWKNKGVQVGIRDYYGVMAWDWDMPGQPNGSRIGYVSQLKNYYNNHIRFFSAETNIGWISRGLGHYVAARLLWDVETNVGNATNEFFDNMFGSAATDIKTLFERWQNYKQAVPLDGDLFEWTGLLESAERKETDKEVRLRIEHIKRYLHYVVLFKRWKQKGTDENLIGLLNFAYRIQDDGVVASYPLFRRLANSAVSGKANMRFNDPKALWKRNSSQVSSEEIGLLLEADKKSLNKLEKATVISLPGRFKQKSVIADVPVAKESSLPIRLRGSHKVVFQIREPNGATINLSSGLIKAHQYKTLRLSIFPYNETLNTGGEKVLVSASIEPKKPLKGISLSSLKPGLYVAVIDDARNGFTMSFTGNVSFAVLASAQNRIWTFARNNLFFSVGKEDKFQIKNDGVMTLVSPKGRVIDLQNKKGIFTISVEKGEEGLWKMQRQSGIFHIHGVLPFINTDQSFLLLKED